MTKADIVDIISSSTGLTKVETEAVVNGFKVVKRAQRVARNPKTNEELIVPEQYVPVLKMSKDFKESVNKSMMEEKD